jgi:hypothetical protein
MNETVQAKAIAQTARGCFKIEFLGVSVECIMLSGSVASLRRVAGWVVSACGLVVGWSVVGFALAADARL